jgi:hypothetical protein
MRRRALLFLLPLAALTATLSFGAVPAAAKGPCWRALFVDCADGRIDRTYPVHCYREAIAHLQQDTLTYGDAADQINRALMAAMTKMRKDDVAVTPNTQVPPGPGSSDGPNSSDPSSQHDESFWDQVSHAVGPTNADAVPLPLLILAGLAMLLLAAAAASLIAKRIQAKKARPATVPPPPDPRS